MGKFCEYMYILFFSLQRMHSNSVSLFQYYHVMSKEYLTIPKGDDVQFSVWRILSSDIDLFTISNIRYDNVLLFIGERNIHWIYFNLQSTFASAEGMTPLTINYCSCCFNQKYLQFIASIQENLEATGYLVT